MKFVVMWSVVLAAGIFLLLGFGAAVLAHHPSVIVYCDHRVLSPGEGCQEADSLGQPHLYTYEQMEARWSEIEAVSPPWAPLIIGGVLTPVGAIGLVVSIRRRRAALNAAAAQQYQQAYPGPQQFRPWGS